VLDEREPLPTDTAVGEVPQKQSSPVGVATVSNMSMKSREKWTEEPAVKKTLEKFRGDIVDIRE